MYPQLCHVTTLHFTRVNSAIKRAYLQLYIYKLHVAYSFIESEQKGIYFHHAERMINEKREKRKMRKKNNKKEGEKIKIKIKWLGKRNKQVKFLELKYISSKDKNSTEN